MGPNEETLFQLLPEELRRIARALDVVRQLGGYGKVEINLKNGIVDPQYGIFMHPAIREPMVQQTIQITALHQVIKPGKPLRDSVK